MSAVLSIRTILCPTDFSDFAKFALDHASAIAASFGARIECFHVMPQTLMQPELFPYMEEPLLPHPEIRERARKRLEEFASEVSPRGLAMETRLEAGEAVRRILARAEKTRAGLIVLGTHGRSGLPRFILGSVADRVLRSPSCPVLTVGSPLLPDQPADRVPYRKILVAVDFSDPSLFALSSAVTLAEAARGELIAAHVIERDWGLSVEETREKLRRALTEASGETLAGECLVIDGGTPHRQLERLAAERSVELIAAGVHGRGAVDQALLGSTVTQLVRVAECPVLTVPGQNRSKEVP